jgi:predicted DNA-binding protein
VPRYAAGSSMREKQLNIRLSPEEAARLEMVAAHYSLSAAAVLRMLVKREHDSLVDAREAKASDKRKAKR